ncbi:hypothetical protein MRX96_002809 [Rhipicephalus microplus]
MICTPELRHALRKGEGLTVLRLFDRDSRPSPSACSLDSARRDPGATLTVEISFVSDCVLVYHQAIEAEDFDFRD